LEFIELESGRTRAVLTNSRISTDERRESQNLGWNGCLDQLERMLTG
jgi:hypothetical protein